MQDTQQRSIQVGENLAMELINDQAGSLVDGWREAIQNGIDSPGSDKVTLDFDYEESTIFDNGDGMDLTDEKMANVLETLGDSTKERDDDNTIGQFGIGFGQVLAKGAVIVHSRSSVAVFDVAGKKTDDDLQEATPSDTFEDIDLGEIEGLNYALGETQARCGGFEITILHYEDEVPEEGSTEWDEYEGDIRSRFKYIGVSHGMEVYVNGSLVSDEDPEDALSETNDYQKTFKGTEYVLAVEHSVDDDIAVYSNGLFVTGKPGKGLHGVVVTKKNLDLNFARNEIKSGCDLWDEISTHLDDLREEILGEVPDTKLNKRSRKAVVQSVREGKTEWKDRDVLKKASGDPVSIEEVEEADEVVKAGYGDKFADKLEERGVMVLQQHDAAVKAAARGDSKDQLDFPEERDVIEMADEMGVVEGHEEVDKSDWSWGQKVRAYFAQGLVDRLANSYDTGVAKSREIRIGEDDSAKAWTDGESYIYLTDSAWTKSSWRLWTVEIFETVVHELAHEEDDTGSMVHGTDFNRRYEKIASKGESVLVGMMEEIDDMGLHDFLRSEGYDDL